MSSDPAPLTEDLPPPPPPAAPGAGAEALVPPTPASPQTRRFDGSLIDGPLLPAVWKLAWPTMLQNVIGGLQGMIDHAMVGNYIGYTANAAIGVSWQIFVVVMVFVTSLFTGMSVLVARFAGQGDAERVDRTVYQAFLAAIGLSAGILAPLGWFLAPTLLDLVNAAPAVQAEALPYLRIMFLFSGGTIVFFMTAGALRSAGDARTPLRLGIAMTVLNIGLNVVLIRGLGPIPAMGTAGAAMGTVVAGLLVAGYATVRLARRSWVVGFPHAGSRGVDWAVVRALFRFGLPAGFQGVAMNVGAVVLLGFIGSLAVSAQAQAAYAVAYAQLFSLVTWSSVGIMGAAATVAGQSLGAGRPDRAEHAVHVAARTALGMAVALGAIYLLIPEPLLALFGMTDPQTVALGVELLRVLAVSGLFISVALAYTGGLQGAGDTRSPLYISIVSQLLLPIGICLLASTFGTLEPIEIWLAILAGHVTRCGLTYLRFGQGRWRGVEVRIDEGGSDPAIRATGS